MSQAGGCRGTPGEWFLDSQRALGPLSAGILPSIVQWLHQVAETPHVSTERSRNVRSTERCEIRAPRAQTGTGPSAGTCSPAHRNHRRHRSRCCGGSGLSGGLRHEDGGHHEGGLGNNEGGLGNDDGEGLQDRNDVEHRGQVSDAHLDFVLIERGDFRLDLNDHNDDAGHDDDHNRQGGHHVGTDMITTHATQEPRVIGDVPAFDDPAMASRSVRAIGTTATVAVTSPDRVDEALALLTEDLAALDLACSRFREDSEIRRVEERSFGHPVGVGPLLFEALEVACAIAAQTAGIVDPTIGSALVELGYDRDFDELMDRRRTVEVHPEPAPGWWRIRLDGGVRTVSIPAGVHVDLGATAKAFAADRAARRIAASLDCGALVNLGGDVALGGPAPTDGWAVGIASHCTTPTDEVDVVLSVHAGGVATSGTTARTWTRDGRVMHHIVDPWTGEPAPRVWSLVSTLAASCVEANAWSTAAIVWGDDAIGNLRARGVPARLVDAQGSVTHVGQWPTDFSNLEGRVQ